MLLKKIKTLIVGLAVLISMNAEAKVEQFQDSFAGYLDRSTRNDAIWYSGQSTFINNNVSSTTTYDLFDDDFSFFIVAGTFARDDGSRKFAGNFDINLYSVDPDIWPDPWQFPGVPYEIIGNFQYDHSIYSPVTGERVINDYGFGLMKGFMVNQQYLTFTIDWMTVNGAVVSSVPTPPTVWMFSSGLLLLGVMLSKRGSPKLHNSLLPITKARDSTMIKITKLLLFLAILVRTHADAKVQTLEEVFTGTITKTGVIDKLDVDVF